MQVPGRLVPWIFLILVLPVALVGLDGSAPTPCEETPRAFREGVTTEQSTTLGVLASTCSITRNSDGAVAETTIVNWSGIVAAIALLAGAWLLGAMIGQRISLRRGAAGIAVASAAMVAALATLFL